MPTYFITHSRSQNTKHKDFIGANEEEKRKILFTMAKNQYLKDQKNQFDYYFPGYSLKKLFSGKKVLDLGCWCGGKSVSYAERWNVNNMYGIDINKYFMKAAILFSSQRKNQNVKYNFTVGYAEHLPYDDNSFDGIVSWDVFEHVRSLRETMFECKRVLKPGGVLFSVFPSYYSPQGAHLGRVTRALCIQWFFDPKTIQIAYDEIMESRGDEAYRYTTKEKENSRAKLYFGIGINGTTIREFKSIVKEVRFSKVRILLPPFLSVAIPSFRYSKKKYIFKTFISKALKPLLGIEPLQDYLSHCIVSILVA